MAAAPGARRPIEPDMAHPQQLAFVELTRRMFPEAFRGRKVLEIGSLDLNGSVRRFFSECDYLGIDVAPGPGVDLVCQGQDYAAPDASFDTVISCEAMEHNPHWRDTFGNMLRLCRPGGLVVMSCASTGRPEHGTRRTAPDASPLTVGLGWDYYRNLTRRDFTSALDLGAALTLFGFFVNWKSCDLYFVGFRGGAEPPPGARRKLRLMRWHYLRLCARAAPNRLGRRLRGRLAEPGGGLRPAPSR
jgi:SAM-dependent methyltransferase